MAISGMTANVGMKSRPASARRGMRLLGVFLSSAMLLSLQAAEEWPVLKTYRGAALRRVKMPLGGIGTGTISLSGRGSLVDWELWNRPAKGNSPTGVKAPHFAVRYETKDGTKKARILEGPLFVDEYEGAEGSPVVNHGFPRFREAIFKAAYPLAQIELRDPDFLLSPRLEAFNPLVQGDPDDSGIPAVLFRWTIANPANERISVSVVGSIKKDDALVITVPDGAYEVSRATDIREPGWHVGADRYWRTFLEKGIVANTPLDDSTAKMDCKANQICAKFILGPGETRKVSFVIAWRNPDRKAWGAYDSKNPEDVVGNWYATRYPTAQAAADDLLSRLPELEAKTVDFVKGILAKKAPDVVKEAALFNLSTFRTETCFRTADGHFYGWEGCRDTKGSCQGSCTHVWGYEHCLVDMWPSLARDMVETQFGPASDPETGHMNFRVSLPRARAMRERGKGTAAADGQMQCVIKAYEVWRKAGTEDWLRGLWPKIRRAVEFCWIEGGWDADRDGVMEGCQHNTMDVEYFGPNPQMEFLYLAALKAAEAMATACGDADFATECAKLFRQGSAWTEKNLFNGSYYEHRIMPPKGAIAKGLRHGSMGAKDLADPDYQLGAGCLIDQLVGDFSARVAGLGTVVDASHERTTLGTILARCAKPLHDETFNCMRGYALDGEVSLKMAWYPEGRLPRSPFPYYGETMTGFEYVVAGLLAMNGEFDKAEKVVRDIRERYDGVKRNPFDEAECGHHYARALAAWSVLKAWENR